MRSYKLAKYNIKSILKGIIIYYALFICVITGIELIGGFSIENGSSSGLEFSSAIFLFVLGLNSFRETFYFTQANNIPRMDYFKATAISIFPIALAMSIFDVIINRVHNLISVSPTMYDMAYYNSFSFKGPWTQSNSIQTLFGTITFLFALYIVAFGIGLLITMIYYKCNKIMKIIVSLSPVAVSAIYGQMVYYNHDFGQGVAIFIDNILGISTKNSYMAVITFICLFIILMMFVYLLVRKAVIKKV